MCEVEKGYDDVVLQLNPGSQATAFDFPGASAQARLLKMKKPSGFEISAGQGQPSLFVDAGNSTKRDVWMRTIKQVVSMMGGGPGPKGFGKGM